MFSGLESQIQSALPQPINEDGSFPISSTAEKYQLYNQLKAQFQSEMEAYKQKFKQEQIDKIKDSFQQDFETILAQAKEQMQAEGRQKIQLAISEEK